jgi:hypothetical protein
MPLPVVATGTATVTTTPSSDGSFLVTLAVNAQLVGVSPAAVKGAWSCSAKAASKHTIDAELGKINALTGRAALDAYQSALIYPAHYLGQQATVEFAIANGSYRGRETITIKLAGRDLADRATGHVIDDPGVMVGCWLQLYDSAGKGGFAYESGPATAGGGAGDVMLRVPSTPYVLLSAAVPNG